MINGTEELLALYDFMQIIFDDKCIALCRIYEYGDKPFTFDDVLNIAKENGYKVGVITLICESPLQGIIYQYGNCHDGKWYEHGTTVGYA